MKLTRASSTPILLPDPASEWETYNVFNPSVIYANGLFHMHYRAQGLDWISRIGYAVSDDGMTWNRLRRPVLEPVDERDSRGVEDPRVTEIDGTYYMAYTAYGSSRTEAFRITPMFARSHNLITWERIGPLVQGEDNKDHVLFPRKIDGCYVSLHRRPPQVWLAESDDLIIWPEERMRPIFGPRPDNAGWDEKRVGGNGVPIETPYGWLMLYHAYNDHHVYRIGVCLLDLHDPSCVLSRPREFIFEPEELWELRGDVPNVVFSCANPVVNDIVHVYYGGADHVIGLATCDLPDLLDYARHG
jgi:beta-1,2-mannobiose phosphorylase / 1,2-beta-oligomannan phosphorylase